MGKTDMSSNGLQQVDDDIYMNVELVCECFKNLNNSAQIKLKLSVNIQKFWFNDCTVALVV